MKEQGGRLIQKLTALFLYIAQKDICSLLNPIELMVL